MAKGFQVAPVEGRTIVDPFNTRHSAARSSAPQRRLGFTRKIDPSVTTIDPRSGKKVPLEQWERHAEPETVLETSDGFYARAIRDGDLDYLGSVEIAADGTTKPLPLDRELLKITAVNQALRARAAKAAKAAESDATTADEEARAYAAEAVAALDAKPAAKPAAEAAKSDATTTPPSAA